MACWVCGFEFWGVRLRGSRETARGGGWDGWYTIGVGRGDRCGETMLVNVGRT
jgi:hypothetical protein